MSWAGANLAISGLSATVYGRTGAEPLNHGGRALAKVCQGVPCGDLKWRAPWNCRSSALLMRLIEYMHHPFFLGLTTRAVGRTTRPLPY